MRKESAESTTLQERPSNLKTLLKNMQAKQALSRRTPKSNTIPVTQMSLDRRKVWSVAARLTLHSSLSTLLKEPYCSLKVHMEMQMKGILRAQEP